MSEGRSMDIRALGYLVIQVSDPARWRSYAEMLGTMPIPADNGAGFDLKIDERPYRIAVRPTAGPEGLARAGWELPDASAFETAARELSAAGIPVTVASEEECEARKVREMLHTTDPGGFDLELFWGPIHDHRMFVSPAGVTGFVTGDMGLGHIVLGTPNLAESVDFYIGLLGFRVSDYWRPGRDDVVFTHCNPRHHSLALVSAADPQMYHFMLEARTLDDVGYALDRHERAGAPISMGLGRHTNDKMVSFYSRSPSGFDVEFGCGGIRIDDAEWTVSEVTKPSLWGHRPPRS